MTGYAIKQCQWEKKWEVVMNPVIITTYSCMLKICRFPECKCKVKE